MQENTESEKPEDSLDKEEHLPDAVETPENSAESDPGFEEQEFLPQEEKKKSGAGKVFLLLVFVLAGSGGYLYFNNLSPAEILNFVFPKSAPSKPLALVTPTPPFMDETVAENSEPADVPEAEIAKPATVSPPETEEAHISGTPSIPPDHIPGSDFDQTPGATEEEELQETASLEEPEPTIEQKVAEEVVTEMIASPEPSTSEPDELQRTEAVQAYLDFIESSVQKLGQLIKEGFNWGWDYLKQKLS